MLALMNFIHRDGWSFDILVEDQRTRLISDCAVGKRETLLSFIARLHGNAAEAKFVTGRKNQGASGSTSLSHRLQHCALISVAIPRTE